MSVAGIASSLASYLLPSSTASTSAIQFRQEFQQLGQDLQAGNLKAAQSDLAALQKLESSSSSTSTNPLTQTFQQIGNDLQSGDLQDAQSLYAAVQQKFQAHHGHHMHRARELSQDFSQLGQDLQAGNLSAAQQAYSSLQQDLTDVAPAVSALTSSSLNNLSVQG